MITIKSIFNALPVILGALYLIADATDMDYEYAWDHSIYPPFTGINKQAKSRLLLFRYGREHA